MIAQLKAFLFVCFMLWVAMQFAGCAGVKQCRADGWAMPNGVKCQWKAVQGDNVFFRECDDGREYMNPASSQYLEVCE